MKGSRHEEALPEGFSPPEKYEILGVAAMGGMGTILRVREETTGRIVAMKVMRKAGSPEAASRFLTEAKVTARLEHPNIVPVHDLDKDAGFYTMKFAGGSTLHDILEKLHDKDAGTIASYPLPSLLTIFQKVCDAVSFAHGSGVLHRDLKPDNVMVGDYGEVLVMDWGLAKEAGVELPGEQPESDIPDAFVTMAGQVLGTPQYMSPEQARGEIGRLDARTDIYSLGAVLYHICFLRPPAHGQTPAEVVKKIGTGELRPELASDKAPAFYPPHLAGERVPESLCAVLRKALAFESGLRYGTVGELQAEITAYQNGFATAAENAGAARQFNLLVRRHKTVSALLAAALLMAAAFTLTVTRERNAAVRERNNAEKALADLHKTAPDFFALAQSLLNEGRVAEAIEKVGYAVRLDGNCADYHQLRGNLLQSTQKLAEAAASYRRVLELRPGDAAARENLLLCEQLLAANAGPGELKIDLQKRLLSALRAQHRLVEAGPLSAAIEPDRAIAEAVLRARLHEYKKQPEWVDSCVYPTPDGKFGVNLDHLATGDLSVLKGQPVSELALNYTNTCDISALAGLPLRVLSLNYSHVADLAPLRGMPLESLEMTGLPVSDLSPLRGMRLRRLVLNRTQVNSLVPLAGMPLETLSLKSTPVSEIAPLKGAPLATLNLAATRVTDISPLAAAPLQSLDISFTQVASLDPLANCSQLKRLLLSNTRVLDITPLRKLKLHELDFTNTNISNIAPLAGMPLEKLRMDRTYVDDLAPLASMPTLREISFPPTAKGVESLRKLHLDSLSSSADKPPQPAQDFWREWDAGKVKAASAP